jgi:hypothetical protein
VEPLKTSLYGVKKLTDYKRIQKSKDRVPIKETPRTVLPQPEKKPVLLANPAKVAPHQGPERSSVFEILKRNKSFEKYEPLALLTINT